MADNVLSQDEIDALLSAMDSGEVDLTAKDEPPEAKAEAYDITSQNIMLRDQFSALEEVYDKFSGLLQSSLTGLLQQSFEVQFVSTEMVKYGDFIQAFSNPTSFNIFTMDPLVGSALLAIEPGLVFSMIDCMFSRTSPAVAAPSFSTSVAAVSCSSRGISSCAKISPSSMVRLSH